MQRINGTQYESIYRRRYAGKTWLCCNDNELKGLFAFRYRYRQNPYGMPDDEARLYKLRKVTKANLHNTLRILRYNKAYNINVYRFTSKLVPLATHPMLSHWDYVEEFEKELRSLGDFVKENNFRVSAHHRPIRLLEIIHLRRRFWKLQCEDLDYYVKLFEAMGLEVIGINW